MNTQDLIPSQTLPETFGGAKTIMALDLGTTTGWAIRGFDGLITSGTVNIIGGGAGGTGGDRDGALRHVGCRCGGGDARSVRGRAGAACLRFT